MADLSDVTRALAQLASAALYPSGTSQPSVALPTNTITVNDGWPEPKPLDNCMAAGNAMLSVYQARGMGSNTNRFSPDRVPATSIPPAQLTLSVSGNRVTIGGAINAGEAPTIAVNYRPYSHSVLASDTTASIASALAALIPNATASGNVITIGGDVFSLSVAMSVPVEMLQEIGRETQLFWLIAWCPTPAMRDAISKTVDVAFRAMPRIVMPDNTWARLIYRGTTSIDHQAKQNIYRRDLRYEVEYVATSIETDNTVTNFAVSTSLNCNPATTINI